MQSKTERKLCTSSENGSFTIGASDCQESTKQLIKPSRADASLPLCGSAEKWQCWEESKGNRSTTSYVWTLDGQKANFKLNPNNMVFYSCCWGFSTAAALLLPPPQFIMLFSYSCKLAQHMSNATTSSLVFRLCTVRWQACVKDIGQSRTPRIDSAANANVGETKL